MDNIQQELNSILWSKIELELYLITNSMLWSKIESELVAELVEEFNSELYLNINQMIDNG